MLKNPKSIRFLHLVDHNGPIFDLISPLSYFKEHKILTSFYKPFKETMKQIEKMAEDNDITVILHATGNKKRFYKEKDKIFKIFKKNCLFLHVSPKHFIIKKRLKELSNIKKLSERYNTKILTPSKNLKKKFLLYGIDAIPIQIGLNFKIIIKEVPRKEDINIITVCTSKDKRYQYIKGIDLFVKLMKKLKMEKESAIFGANLNQFNGIRSKKVSKKSFLKYLQNSKVYVQLSRTESYNSSAIYAKRMKIPIIASDIEGHKDNIKYGFRVKNLKETEGILKRILRNNNDSFIKKIIKKNYKDSVKRESLRNFANSLNNLLDPKYQK